MGDETKARNSQENEKKYITTSVDVASYSKAPENVEYIIQNKDTGTVTDVSDPEQIGIRARGIESPIRESDNTKDLTIYNSADNVREALREMKSPTKFCEASNFDEDASTSKQQPKNSKDKGADSKSLVNMQRAGVSGSNPLKRPGGRTRFRRSKISREDFYKGKLSNVVFGSYQPSSTSDSEIRSIGSSFSSA